MSSTSERISAAGRGAMPFLYLVAIMMYSAVSLPAQAAPRTGPDRPFTLGWRVVVPPAPHLWSATFGPGTTSGVAVGDDGTILRTEDGGKHWDLATIPSGTNTDLRAVVLTGATTGVAHARLQCFRRPCS